MLQAVDLDGDSKKELIVKGEYVRYFYRTPRAAKSKIKKCILLLNEDLEIEKIFDDATFGAVYDLDGDGVNELVISREKEGLEIWGFKNVREN